MVAFTELGLEALDATELVDGFGLFRDGVLRYAAAEMKRFRVDVMRRLQPETFTDLIRAQPRAVRVAINGQYIGGNSLLYARAAGSPLVPEDVPSVGAVRSGGTTVLPDDEDGESYFYFGRDAPGTHYLAGFGNPPPTVFEGMGGLGPLILPNKVTGERLRYGSGNRYRDDPSRAGMPPTDEEWRAIVQRNNETYKDIAKQVDSSDIGFCFVAANHLADLVVMGAKPHGEPGSLDSIRDALWDAGFDRACFTDGSTSTCFAVDREIVFAPAAYKDGAIEVGFALARAAKSRVKLRIVFKSLEVLKVPEQSGDFGLYPDTANWTLIAAIADTEIGRWHRTRLEVGEIVDLDASSEVEVDDIGGVRIKFGGTEHNRADHDLPSVAYTLEAGSDPPWGEGAWVSTTEQYRLRYGIEVLL